MTRPREPTADRARLTRLGGLQVADGRYASANEVVSSALKLMEEDEAQLKALEAALIEGEESGEAVGFDIEELIARARRDFEREIGKGDAAA